jgi:hypothetical protein
MVITKKEVEVSHIPSHHNKFLLKDDYDEWRSIILFESAVSILLRFLLLEKWEETRVSEDYNQDK